MGEIEIDMVELEAPVTDDDHMRGDPDAPLTLVEYADYQCEACIDGFHAVEELIETHSDKVNVVFRHFPLMSYHPMALPGAMAAEAAAEQGKFWEMHAKIFGAGGEFDEDDLVQWAEELGLDMEQFEEDRHSAEIEEHIREVRLEGARSGVNGTPTFFLDNWRIDVYPTHEHLAAYVDHFYAHMSE
ncbi:MAG: DsbA family protein [Armatimonadota bacterium]